MNIVKVDATISTNTLAREINQANSFDAFCVSAEYQTQGRGQQQSQWNSKKSLNLTFTLVFNHLQLDVKHQFMLNALVCLNIYQVLKTYQISGLFLKWPNDILADHKKICGILIENTLANNVIKTSYVGIGLNVNQENFDNLLQAGSLKNNLGKSINRHKLLEDLVHQLKNMPTQLHAQHHLKILNDYKAKLYKFNETSKFILNAKIMDGKIKNVLPDGRLVVKFGENETKMFQYKAIKQLY